MARPAKPYNVVINEGVAHRTKAELKQRKKAEESTLTGNTMVEQPDVRNTPHAHKEFLRVRNLFKILGKNDEIYAAVINRYCLLHSECHELVEKRETFYKDLNELTTTYNTGQTDLNVLDYFKLKDSLMKQIIALDKQVQSKRKMLFDIEKENIMTIASALRSIPKKVEKKKDLLGEALLGN